MIAGSPSRSHRLWLYFSGRAHGLTLTIDAIIAKLGSVANRIVERQDKRIVETQIPKASALRMNENLVAADMPIIEYRSKREKLKGV